MLAEVYARFSALFNTREQAYMFWGLPLFIWLLSAKKSRASFGILLKALFCRQFVVTYILALTYMGVVVLLLNYIGIWSTALVKDTVMWVIFVAQPLMYQAGRIDSFGRFFKEIIKPLVAFSIVFEYIFGLYTFELWIEVLTVPVAVLIAGMLVVSERRTEYAQVNKLLKGLLSILGLIAISCVLIHLIRHYKEYGNVLVLMQFLMPLSMSLSFLPFLYGISMYVHYEQLLISLERHFRHGTMYQYAILMAMLRFNGDLAGMLRWKQMVLSKNLQTKTEINESISLIKTLQHAERNPHTVAEGLGWSPYQVKDLLASKGILTSEYKNTVDDEFMSLSSPFKLNGNSALSDTISYMVLGEQLIATKLDLGLKVYDGTQDSTLSLLQFLNCCEVVFESVSEKILPKEIEDAIFKGKNLEMSSGHVDLKVSKKLWPNKTKGYSLDFEIIHERHRPQNI